MGLFASVVRQINAIVRHLQVKSHMSPQQKLPKTENIPPLSANIEGLKRHSVRCFFVPEPELTADDRKLRGWLLHTLGTAAGHYSKLRELVSKQEAADQSSDGGVIFYVLDVSEQIEGCALALNRVCVAAKRMSGSLAKDTGTFTNAFSKAIGDLSKIRNQFEHLHSQIVAAETGPGPISMIFGDEGRSIKFRRLRMQTSDLHRLIEGAYRFVATMYPSFKVDSKPEPAGHIKLTMTCSVTVVDGATGEKKEL